MSSLFTVLNQLRSNVSKNEILKLIYVSKAWKVLSESDEINDDLSFGSFYNQKIEVQKLAGIFKVLAKEQKLFDLYRLPDTIDSYDLTTILKYVYETEELESINKVFFEDDKYQDYSATSQIADLGIRLLDGEPESIYVPFTNGFAYADFTDKKLSVEYVNADNALIAELIKIIEDKDMEFKLTDTLMKPAFLNPAAPHLLRQFDSVLSFPPFGLRKRINLSGDQYNRFKIHKGTNLDVAYFEHILSQTSGKAVVLMAVGFTYRSGTEEAFRKILVDNNWLETIIQLPPNLHNATAIETTFFIVNKHKTDDLVYFMNLKDDRFLMRNGRKIVLKDLDEIVDIYKNRQNIENIAALIDNKTISENNHSCAIDRYVISKEAAQLNEKLSMYELTELQNIADIRRSQLFKNEEEGDEVHEVSPSDLASAGFTIASSRIKHIGSQHSKLQTYKLQPYDVLVSTKGTIGKIGIIGEINKPMIASQAMQVIRIKDETLQKEKAIELYMFFKSDIGQAILKQLVAGVAMPQIATAEIKQMKIPILSEYDHKQVLINFNSEIILYEEIEAKNRQINKIHSDFLGANE